MYYTIMVLKNSQNGIDLQHCPFLQQVPLPHEQLKLHLCSSQAPDPRGSKYFGGLFHPLIKDPFETGDQ